MAEDIIDWKTSKKEGIIIALIVGLIIGFVGCYYWSDLDLIPEITLFQSYLPLGCWNETIKNETTQVCPEALGCEKIWTLYCGDYRIPCRKQECEELDSEYEEILGIPCVRIGGSRLSCTGCRNSITKEEMSCGIDKELKEGLL